jgi:hypothetical protein
MAVKQTHKEEKESAFFTFDQYFAKHQNLFFYLSMALLTLFGILLFDVRVSIGGDDSGYLFSAKKFIDGEVFPTYHGAFYSMLIGWIMKLTGFHLVFFKLLSLLFLLGHQVFLYYALKERISSFILAATLLISSVCSGLIYFGSQTYTEAFYIFLQGAFLFIFFKYLSDVPNNFNHIRKSWPAYLSMGAVILMIYTTRNVGFVTLVTLLLYLLLNKKYIPALYTVGFYQLFSFPYGLYKRIAWGITEADMSGQLKIIAQKNPYNRALGTEDWSGFLTRIVENLKNYMSKIFLHELGLKDASNNDTSLFIALLIIGLLLLGLVLAFVYKNKALQFLLLYLGMGLGVTFIALHQMWAQPRMVIVFIPLLIIALAWTFGAVSQWKKLRFVKYVAVAFLIVIFFKSFLITAKKASDHQEVLVKNLSGNKYYGFTPDWSNFLKMSEWASKRIDKNVQIGSRKPSMSFIYGNGREFYAMYRLPVQFSDSVMAVADTTASKQVYFIVENSLGGKPMTLYNAIKPDMYAGISVDNVLYGVYFIDKQKTSELDIAFEQLGISVYKSASDFKTDVLSKAKNTSAVVPDDLLNSLKENNVQYVIVGNLRANPKMKTDRTVNTVARYIAGIQLKYPNVAKQVHQIGRNDNEPARLFKIDFGQQGK